MEEADRILINSLISIGLEVDNVNITLDEFSPDILINATSLCLEYIFESRNEHQSFPKSCPANMASRYKVGQALAEAIKSLGYKDSIGYQTFLYPNVKDNRKIISFLVEALPKESGPSVVEGSSDAANLKSQIKSAFIESWKSPWLPHYCLQQPPAASHFSTKSLVIPFAGDSAAGSWQQQFPPVAAQTTSASELAILARQFVSKTRISATIDRQLASRRIEQLNRQQEQLTPLAVIKKPEPRKRTKFAGKPNESRLETAAAESDEQSIERAESEYNALQASYEAAVTSYDRLLAKLQRVSDKHDDLLRAERDLAAEAAALQQLVAVKQKIGIVLARGESSVPALVAAIGKRESAIEQAQRQWRAHRDELQAQIDETRRRQRAKFQRTIDADRQLEEVRVEMEECRWSFAAKETEIRALDEKVQLVLRAASGGASAARQSRNDFTKRILELAQNRKKQNEEIRKILADIFRLQKEINSLRGKLDRSFVETSDCIAEFARRDESSRKMHKALLGIHDNCGSLVEVIEEKGRLLREIRDLEAAIDNENRDDVEKNLHKITADHKEALASCAELKRRIKEQKATAGGRAGGD